MSNKQGKIIPYALIVCILLASGGFLFGYDNSVISGAIGYMTEYFAFDSATQGFVVSIITIGAVIGSLVAGPLSDLFGRKPILLLSAVLFAISSFGQGYADSLAFLTVSRLLAGAAIGVANTITPVYISELAPSRIRGALASSYQLVVVIGITAVYFVNASIADFSTHEWNVTTGWRVMLYAGAIPAIIFLIATFFVPESPRWLEKVGKEKKFLSILRKLRSSEEFNLEVKEIKETSQTNKQQKVSLKTLKEPKVRRIVLIGFILAGMQHLTGIDAITYYAPEIFKAAGAGNNAALYNTIFIGLALTIFTVVAILTVDKFGRKKLLIIGMSIMTVALFVVGILFMVDNAPFYLLLTFIVLFIAGFSIGIGSVMWGVLGEIFPTNVRGLAMSLSMVSLWGANYIVAQFFPIILENVGAWLAFFIFGALSFITLLFVIKYIPETKGKTLEEIERELV